ncbi:alanyl-tRNA editing protein [Paracidobacterium acidisoli]|uniref:Alanyl-tRNA editing protein n=1 Tax=Paracidobacterium acidisoli TaxID=2303751 RepID=A0A372IL73_9BACT|nr:DHHA1 domain-containing protein [Paracidobacterium acidisoli]MBT9332285.1 alanyl-tRNA editing protein [Paracidobacterium acidisoli]
MSDRLYYADSFLKSFEAAVTDIREVSRTAGRSVWQVALDRTAFYPTSGGQPFDTGVLRAVSRTGAVLEAPIESVEEDEHGEVWHTTEKPLLAGSKVEGEIVWSRRLDHMQQHTGQHLLSAIFARELHLSTVSFHLGETASTIDLAGTAPAHHSLERVERIVNEIIAEDRPVRMQVVPREKAEALLAEGQLRKLPEREGEIRLIEIEECDLNACGGTHVRSTGQIGGLLVRGTEKVARGVRVEFVCGLRAVAAARHDAELLERAAALISGKADDLPAALERLKSETKASAKQHLRLSEELAGYHATRLAVEVPIEDQLRLVSRVYADRDREYLRLLASRLTASVPQTVALLFGMESDPGSVVLAHSHDMEFHCGQLLREALASFGMRGGGAADLAQGEIAVDRIQDLRTALTAAIRDRVPSVTRR